MNDYRNKFYSKYVSTHVRQLYGDVSLNDIKKQFLVWKKYFGRFLSKNKNAKIIDLGCGNGGFVWYLQKLGFKDANGIDISKEQVQQAEKLGIKNIFHGNFLEFLKDKKEIYDVIFARDVLEHFSKEEILDVLYIISGSLKKGGTFIIQTINAENFLWGRLRHGDFTHDLAFTKESITQILNISGFSEIKVYPQNLIIHGLKSFIRAILWKYIELKIKFYLLIETGSVKGIFTQNIIISAKKMKKYKLAVLTSHPIQYQAPLFKKISESPEIDLMVYFNWDFGIKSGYDREFGKKFKWDISLLNGYKYKFLKNFSLKPSSDFLGQLNFGIIKEIYDLRFKNYDAILIYGWNSFTNLLAFLTAFIFKIPVLLRGENPLNQELLKPRWKIKIKKIILNWLFKHISAFLYIGEENKKFYKNYGVSDEKLFFAPYAVDNERFIRSVISNQELVTRNKLKIGKDDVVILFVGKFIDKKRPMDLLKAYETITRNIQMSPNITNKIRIIEKELSYKLNGIFFEIHNELGRFVRERQCADALEIKLQRENIKYKREFAVLVAGRKSNFADFIIEDKILVELKRKPVNTEDDYKQIMRYLESIDLELGLLVNFGLEYLKPKRILNPKFKNRYSVNSDYSIHLLFIGSGELEFKLKEYAEKMGFKKDHSVNSDKFVNSGYGIHFVGFKNQTELPQYYAMADVFVLPSGIGETWGLVVNEAMCFSLPIIVSDTVGCGSNLVKNGENGYIFKVGNINELTKYLMDLIGLSYHNPKYPNESEYNEYKNIHSVNLDKFVDSGYGSEKRKSFGKKSLEIIQNYSYEKDIQGILKALKLLKK